jgi:DNA-directed RNA polymerase specialized sigma24 family protein
MGARLGEDEHEDALAFLVATVWEVSTRFDPQRSRCFEHYAYSICRRRAIDWYRRHYGRTRWAFSDSQYEREQPALLSLEESTDSGAGELDGSDADFAGEFEAGRLDLIRALTS